MGRKAVKMNDRSVQANSAASSRLERKFYIEPAKIGFAYGILQHSCRLDPRYPSEQINSLYYDTAELDEHERSIAGEFKKDKVRLRWYGKDDTLTGSQPVFLELKSRRGFASTKQRRLLHINSSNLTVERMAEGVVPLPLIAEALASFGYFPPKLIWPVIHISYWRHRFSELVTGQAVALDSHIRSTMLLPTFGNGETNLELPGAVMEIKGSRLDLPGTLVNARLLDTDWTRFSKYSASIEAHTEQIGAIGRLDPSGRLLNV